MLLKALGTRGAMVLHHPCISEPLRNGHVLLHDLETVYFTTPGPPSLRCTSSPRGCTEGVRAGLMPWVTAKGKGGHAENVAAQVSVIKSVFLPSWGVSMLGQRLLS